jgi:hypothetical protein
MVYKRYYNREQYHKFYLKYKDKDRNRRLFKTYGLTTEDWNKLLESQNYSCAICKRDLKQEITKHIHVDHNHETGKVRGMLCHQCNAAIGLLREDKDIILSSLNYLEKHNAG